MLFFCFQENAEKPKKLLSHLFITEQNNGMKYSTGLVKLLERSGQHIPEQLKTMAASAREVISIYHLLEEF